MKMPANKSFHSPFSQNNYCIIEKYNMAFVVISKNGVTHLKNIAMYHKTGHYPKEEEVHELMGFNRGNGYFYSKSEIDIIEKEQGPLLKFAVWRDPVERLVSCYKLFCLEKEIRYYFNFLNLYNDNSFARFMEFVRFELGKGDPLYQDEHIRRQSDYYQPEDVDFIVPMGKLNQFLVKHGVTLVEETANVTHVDFKLTDAAYIEEIKELYKKDYEIKPNI